MKMKNKQCSLTTLLFNASLGSFHFIYIFACENKEILCLLKEDCYSNKYIEINSRIFIYHLPCIVFFSVGQFDRSHGDGVSSCIVPEKTIKLGQAFDLDKRSTLPCQI